MKISPHDNPSLDEKHPTPPQSPSLPWEESEQYQRFQARTIVVLFVVVVVSSVAHSLYTRNWLRLVWWGNIVSGIFAGILVWSALNGYPLGCYNGECDGFGKYEERGKPNRTRHRIAALWRAGMNVKGRGWAARGARGR